MTLRQQNVKRIDEAIDAATRAKHFLIDPDIDLWRTIEAVNEAHTLLDEARTSLLETTRRALIEVLDGHRAR